MKAFVWLIITALAIWGFCGAIMGIGPRFISEEATLIVHLVGAPIGAAAFSSLYFRHFPRMPPARAATVVVVVALGLDAGLVAPLLLQDWSMFQSPLGLWMPMAAIFAAVFLSGSFMRMSRITS